ncbi:MAG TPA: hypothetical protein PKM65_04290 [Spirochaetota bacterium]|nr:hypothetical protein [Spirochaetota bacterium]HNT10699.1 hypothetical protein [Spirochaetota bacterium]
MILHIYYRPQKKKEALFDEFLSRFRERYTRSINEIKFVPYSGAGRLIAVVFAADNVDEHEIGSFLTTEFSGGTLEEFVFQR